MYIREEDVAMTGIIIQARMGSSRLPGKVFMDFCGKNLLEHILDRLQSLEKKMDIVIATTNLNIDDQIEMFCQIKGVSCFRGEPTNVLKRYYDCATYYQFDNIVRMTGDNPFPDIEELQRLIVYHEKNNMDFSENFSVLPIGVGMEIMTYQALQTSMENAYLPKHFEHVDEYILDYRQNFKCGTVEVNTVSNAPSIRLTVDTKEDYEKACYILRNFNGKYVTTAEAIALSKECDGMRKEV